MNEIAIGVAGANHINICKFSDFNSQKYKPVWNTTEELAQYAVGEPSTCEYLVVVYYLKMRLAFLYIAIAPRFSLAMILT